MRSSKLGRRERPTTASISAWAFRIASGYKTIARIKTCWAAAVYVCNWLERFEKCTYTPLAYGCGPSAEECSSEPSSFFVADLVHIHEDTTHAGASFTGRLDKEWVLLAGKTPIISLSLLTTLCFASMWNSMNILVSRSCASSASRCHFAIHFGSLNIHGNSSTRYSPGRAADSILCMKLLIRVRTGSSADATGGKE